MKYADKIKKGLADPIHVHYHIADIEPRLTSLALHELEFLHEDALALIQQLEDRNNALYHTILGVMHFVDKWLNDKGYDPESDQDGSIAIERAARAREIALRAIEEAEKRQPF